MEQQTFAIGDEPRLLITTGSGDVALSGWAERSISVESESAVEVSREGDTLTINAAHIPLRIRLPNDAAVTIERRDGDVVGESFFGGLSVRDGGDVTMSGRPERWEGDRGWGKRGWKNGNISLERVGAVRLESVPANLLVDTCQSVDARNVGGNLEIARVAGDLALENIGGNCEVEQVSGSARLRNVGGNAHLRGLASVTGLGNVGGNLQLDDTVFSIDAETLGVAVGGNARLTLPDDANVTVSAMTGGSIRFAGAAQRDFAHNATATYGEGRAQLKIMAGGNVEVQGGGVPQVTGASWHSAKGFGGLVGRAVGDAIGAVSRAVEPVARERWQRLEDRVRGGDDLARDRQAILEMVASKRITAEEAAMLLEALK
jgi:hypothetical protein